MRRIAELHEGTVEAIPLQQGVKFRISVPELVADEPTAERTPESPSHDADSEPAFGPAECHSPSLRDRSEAITPAGSISARRSLNSRSRGYIRSIVPAPIRESLAR